MGGRQRRVGIKVDADVRDFNAGMASATRSVRGFVLQLGAASNSAFGRLGLMQAGIAGAAVATAAALKTTVGAAAAFEVQMRNVNSIVQTSEAELGRLSAQVLALGQTVPQSAETLAAGLYDIASSGFQGAEGMQVLEASARAATAGMTDTATAAKGITAVLNAYGLQAADAADVSDILFQTVNVGVITFEELSGVLGDVVGIAAAAGVGIDQVSAALAAMTLSGISADEAGTSLNRLIQKLVQPSEALAAVWRTVSDESVATTLAQEGLGAVMERLRSVVGGNVQVLLALFPEIRAARGAFALLANDGQNYLETQRAITDEQRRANATQKAFNEQMQATSNEVRLVANGMKIWAQEMGAKALPAIRALLDRGRDIAAVVAPAFQTLGDVIGYIGDVAGGHLEIVYALAIAYGVNLLKGLVLVSGELLVGAARWVIYQVEVTKATAAAFGMQFAMQGIVGTAATMGAALIAGLAVKNWIDAKNHAKELVGTMKQGVDTQTLSGLREWNTRLAEQGQELDRNSEKREGWLGAIQDLEDLLPWANDQHAKNTQAIQENAAAREEASVALANFVNNAAALNETTGLSIEQIDQLARKYGIDLTQSGQAGTRAVEQLEAAIMKQRNEMGLTAEQFAALDAEAVEALQNMQAAAIDARDAFLDTFGLLTGFELPDPEEAARTVEETADKVRDAEERLADAREKLADSERFLNPSPQQQREAARARRDVAEAERELAEARVEAREAAQQQLDPEAAISEQYRKQIEAAEQFVNDLDAAARKGVSPDFLLKAQLDPEQYGPILRAIVEDTDGSLVETINASERRLKELGATFEAQFGIMQVAVDNGMTQVTQAMLDHLERAFTDPDGKKGIIAFQFGAYLAEHMKEGIEKGKGGIVISAGGPADLVLANAQSRATGGIDAHIATRQSVLYGERSTGGEAFIPLGPAHRGRSTILLAEVASMFGYGLLPMARGGIIGSATGGVTHISHSKSSSQSIGTVQVVAPNPTEFERWADRKQRLAALGTG